MSTADPFQPSAREQVKARIALTGPAGSGKTYTALTLATHLAEKVAVVDTEHGRALEYRDRFTFRHLAPSSFDPRTLTTYLAAAAEHGYGAIIIDSLSHYWMGTGGALEFVDTHDKAPGGKFSAGWKEYRPIETRMWNALMAYPGHVIATMRVKTAYVVEQEGGKSKPRKVGLKPEQREGTDYEFSIIGEMDREHAMTVTKSTCPQLVDEVIHRPGPEIAEIIAGWCGQGEPVPNALEFRDLLLKTLDFDEVKALRQRINRARLLGAVVIDENGNEASLDELTVRIGNERRGA